MSSTKDIYLLEKKNKPHPPKKITTQLHKVGTYYTRLKHKTHTVGEKTTELTRTKIKNDQLGFLL